MTLTIEHHTQYVYSHTVDYTIQHLRLSPYPAAGLQVLAWEIQAEGSLEKSLDAFGNVCHTLVIDQPHHAVRISVHGRIDTGQLRPIIAPSLPAELYLRHTTLTDINTAMQAFALQQWQQDPVTLMHALYQTMQYVPGATHIETTASQAFHLQRGVCQDYAHIYLAMCRWLGLPARYVSGYLFTTEGHLMQTHAWVEVWQQQHWLGLDIANNMLVNACHVPLAVGLDYQSACPISGTRLGGGFEGMSSLVTVRQNGALSASERAEQLQQLYQQAHMAQQ